MVPLVVSSDASFTTPLASPIAPVVSTAPAVPANPAPNVDAATKPAMSLVKNPILFSFLHIVFRKVL